MICTLHFSYNIYKESVLGMMVFSEFILHFFKIHTGTFI